jgi:hypothetical protein
MQRQLTALHVARIRADMNAKPETVIDYDMVDQQTIEDSSFLGRLFEIYYPAHQKRRHFDLNTVMEDHRPIVARQVISGARAIKEIEEAQQEIPEITNPLPDNLLTGLYTRSGLVGQDFLAVLQKQVKVLAVQRGLAEDAETIALEAVRFAIKSVQQEHEYAQELQEEAKKALQARKTKKLAAIREDVKQMFYLALHMSDDFHEIIAKQAAIYMEAALAFLLLPSVGPQ